MDSDGAIGNILSSYSGTVKTGRSVSFVCYSMGSLAVLGVTHYMLVA